MYFSLASVNWLQFLQMLLKCNTRMLRKKLLERRYILKEGSRQEHYIYTFSSLQCALRGDLLSHRQARAKTLLTKSLSSDYPVSHFEIRECIRSQSIESSEEEAISVREAD